MDPNHTLDIATDPARSIGERLAAAYDLRVWIVNRGFPPVEWSVREAPYAIDRLIAALEDIRQGR